MATMKDVARAADVSASTVSLVINGKAEQYGIPESTRERVFAAVAALDYRPNRAARNLRIAQDKPAYILFWPLDTRTNMLGVFLSSIQLAIAERGLDCELIIQTYTNGSIEEPFSSANSSTYSGIIIGATSADDVAYLESQQPQVPTVLVNRSSDRYSTVGVSALAVAEHVVDLIRTAGFSHVGFARSNAAYLAANQRMSCIEELCAQRGLLLDASGSIHVEPSYAGGVLAAQRFLQLADAPKVMICESETIALGFEHELNRAGARVPEDVAIIVAGSTDDGILHYVTPSITAVQIPSKHIALAALDVLIEAGTQTSRVKMLEPRHVLVDPIVHIRESLAI